MRYLKLFEAYNRRDKILSADFDGAHIAASKYISYLKNTPDKKHLCIK